MRKRFVLLIEDAGPEEDSPPERRLAGLLKTAKRLWNLRCVRATYSPAEGGQPPGGPGAAPAQSDAPAGR